MLDRIVNFTGAAASWPCSLVLCYGTWTSGDSFVQQFCYCLHGVGLVSMFNFSALYHHWSWDWHNAQKVYSPLDQVGINLMLIGCFAPVSLACEGYRVLFSVCALGVLGVVLQSLRLARVNFQPLGSHKNARWTILDAINVVHYVLMGLMVLPDLPVWIEVLPPWFMCGITSGGLLYLVGVPFLLCEHMEFHQAYWHFVVLIASAVMYSVILFLMLDTRHNRTLPQQAAQVSIDLSHRALTAPL